jgi:hypothetical protein
VAIRALEDIYLVHRNGLLQDASAASELRRDANLLFAFDARNKVHGEIAAKLAVLMLQEH